MNMVDSVNEMPLGEAALVRAVLNRLRGLLGEIEWASLPTAQPGIEGRHWDLALQIEIDGREPAQLLVEVKRSMRPGRFLGWADARRAEVRSATAVLAVPRVSDRLDELCRRAGWSWIDLAGNCWIDIPGVARIERRGRKPVASAARPKANLSTAASARVMRALLSPAHAGRRWTQRALAEKTVFHHAGDRSVSLGLVNKVVRYLRDEGFARDDDDGLRVTDWRALLREWATAYAPSRHQRLSCFTLMRPPRLADALHAVAEGSGGLVALASFSAAAVQAPHVRQPNTWAYVAPAYLADVLKRTEAQEVDSGANLIVLVPDDIGVFLSYEIEEGVAVRCTDPVQTYVDLMNAGGRGHEAAEALLEQRIAPAWDRAEVEE